MSKPIRRQWAARSGAPSPGSAAGHHPAVMVAVREGLIIEDPSPAWPSGHGTQPAWCEALVQIPGWARPLRVYSVDLPWRSSVEQRSQAEWLATRIAELRELGALAAIPDAVLTSRYLPGTRLARRGNPVHTPAGA